jgi:hypothetical protein
MDGAAAVVEEVLSDVEAVARSEGRIGRGTVIGAAVGVVGFILLLGFIGIGLGLGPGTAFAISGFTAIWGGLGFGGMCGAVVAYNREQVRSPTHR